MESVWQQPPELAHLTPEAWANVRQQVLEGMRQRSEPEKPISAPLVAIKRAPSFDYVPGGPFSEISVRRSTIGMGTTAHIVAEQLADNSILRLTKIPNPELPFCLEENQRLMLHEIEVYKVLDANPSPYVLQSLGSDPKNYALYLPLRGMNLNFVLKTAAPPSLETRLKWCFQLASAVKHLHSLNVYHCDLSVGNILIDADGTLVICDFAGSSMNFEAPRSIARAHLTIRDFGQMKEWRINDLRQVDVLTMGSLFYIINTAGKWPVCGDWNESDAVKVYARGGFPNTSSVLLGDLIMDIWTGKISDMDAIISEVSLELLEFSSGFSQQPLGPRSLSLEPAEGWDEDLEDFESDELSPDRLSPKPEEMWHGEPFATVVPFDNYKYVPGGPFSELAVRLPVMGSGSTAHLVAERLADNTILRLTKIPNLDEPEELEENRELMLQEIEIYKVLDANPHPCVLHSLGSDPANYALYLPYRGLDLEILLQRYPKPSPESRLKWCFQLASAVQHLHSLHIYHCDLCPANILIERPDTLIVCDFACSSMNFKPPVATARAQLTIRDYRDKKDWTQYDFEQIDIFSMASVFYIIGTGGEWPVDGNWDQTDAIKLYDQGIFPDTSALPLGELIRDIWTEKTRNIDEILRVIAKFLPSLSTE